MKALITDFSRYGEEVWAFGRDLTRDDFELGEWIMSSPEDWKKDIGKNWQHRPQHVSALLCYRPKATLLGELRALKTEKELGPIITFFQNTKIERWPDSPRDPDKDERKEWHVIIGWDIHYRGRRGYDAQKVHFLNQLEKLQRRVGREGDAKIDSELASRNILWHSHLTGLRSHFLDRAVRFLGRLDTYKQDELSENSGTVKMEAELMKLRKKANELEEKIDRKKYETLADDFKNPNDDDWINEFPKTVRQKVAEKLRKLSAVPPSMNRRLGVH